MRRVIRIVIAGALWMTMPSAAFDAIFEPATELLPPPAGESTLPTCRLTRTETELVLSLGDHEVQRFRHRSGQNIVETTDRFDRTLLTALKTVQELRQAGACR